MGIYYKTYQQPRKEIFKKLKILNLVKRVLQKYVMDTGTDNLKLHIF